MFNLFRSRDKSVRYLLSALLFLVALSMVTYLIPGGPGYAGAGGAENVVATVGDQTLTVREVQQAIQTAQKGRQVPPGMMAYVAPQLVEQLITERAVEYQANRMGFQVSGEDVAQAIRQQIPQLFQNGQFVGKETYAAVLAQQNLTVPEFEAYMARQIRLNRLRSVILEGTAVVPDPDIEREFKRRNEKAAVEYVKIDPEQLKKEINISDAEIRDQYNKTAASFKIPEKKSVLLLVVDPASLEAAATVSDAQMKQAYETNKDNYRIPERVRVRHILLRTTDQPKEEVDRIQARAEALLKQVKSGANFADLAKKNSDDPGSKEKGGDLDWVVRGQTVPEFETAAFNMKPNEISNLVKTQYGFHIIQTLEKQDAHLRPLDEVKGELTAELKKQAAADRVQSALDQAYAAIRRTPRDAQQIAQKYGLASIPLENVGPGDPFPHIGINPEFQEALTAARKDDVTTTVAAPGGKTVFAVVRDVIPPRQAAFDEVRGQIQATMVNSRVNSLAEQRAKDLLAKTKSLNGDLKAAAKSMNLTVNTPPEFSRAGAIEGLGSSESVPEAFAKPVGTLFQTVAAGSAQIVGRVSARAPANMTDFAVQKTAIRDELKQSRARERNSLFEDGVRSQLEKDGKLKINKEVVDRLIASYRS